MPPIFNGLGNILKPNKNQTPETTRFIADKARGVNGSRYFCQDFEKHPRQLLFKLPTLDGQRTAVIHGRDSNPEYIVGPMGAVTMDLETGRKLKIKSEAITADCFSIAKGENRQLEGRTFTQHLEFGLRCVYTATTGAKIVEGTVTRTLFGANGKALMSQNPGAYRSPGSAWNIQGDEFDKLEDDVKHYIIGFILSGYYTYAVDQGIPQSAESPVPQTRKTSVQFEAKKARIC